MASENFQSSSHIGTTDQGKIKIYTIEYLYYQRVDRKSDRNLPESKKVRRGRIKKLLCRGGFWLLWSY